MFNAACAPRRYVVLSTEAYNRQDCPRRVIATHAGVPSHCSMQSNSGLYWFGSCLFFIPDTAALMFVPISAVSLRIEYRLPSVLVKLSPEVYEGMGIGASVPAPSDIHAEMEGP